MESLADSFGKHVTITTEELESPDNSLPEIAISDLSEEPAVTPSKRVIRAYTRKLATGAKLATTSPSSHAHPVAARQEEKLANKPIVPYDPRDEKGPSGQQIYTTKFQSALQNGIQIAKEAIEIITTWESLAEDPNLKILKESAERLSKFRVSDSKTIAVIGETGAGRCLPTNETIEAQSG